MTTLPLTGFRIGVTAARKAEEQAGLFERRGATVVRAPVLGHDHLVDDADLRAATAAVLAAPVDVLLGTTGIGLRRWFRSAAASEQQEALLAHLADAEILARGPKTVGALRRHGLRESWVSPTEELDDVVERLRGRDLAGVRIVLQEWGQPLDDVAAELRERGADVVVVAIYRVAETEDAGPVAGLVELLAGRGLDAVTFTSAPAVEALMEVLEEHPRAGEALAALREHVVVASVGPVTAAALEPWGVPSVVPERARLAAMVRRLEDELTSAPAS